MERSTLINSTESLIKVLQRAKESRYQGDYDTYITLLEEIIKSDFADYIIKCKENDEYIILESCISKIVNPFDITFLAELIGEVCFLIAVYYQNSSDRKKLELAFQCISYAISCEYPHNEYGLSVSYNLCSKIMERIDLFQNGTQHSSIPLIEINDCIVRTEKDLICLTGEETWNRFKDETKSSLLTAYVCFDVLSIANPEMNSKIDYSAVTVPLIKTLEYELKIRFFYNYFAFLLKNYSPETYAKENGLFGSSNYDINKARLLFLGQKRGKLYFKTPQKMSSKFTLGSFSYSIGIVCADKKDAYYSDPTIIKYCKDILFEDSSATEEEIDNWLFFLSTEVDSLIKLRNDGAHGGTTLRKEDAKTAADVLIAVDRILIELTTKCKCLAVPENIL